MTRRVLAAFSEIMDDTCLVTHGGVIAAIMAHLFPDAGKNRYQWQPRNGHGYCLTEDWYRTM
jgi:alpha-ribazole phosphatase